MLNKLLFIFILNKMKKKEKIGTNVTIPVFLCKCQQVNTDMTEACLMENSVGFICSRVSVRLWMDRWVMCSYKYLNVTKPVMFAEKSSCQASETPPRWWDMPYLREFIENTMWHALCIMWRSEQVGTTRGKWKEETNGWKTPLIRRKLAFCTMGLQAFS